MRVVPATTMLLLSVQVFATVQVIPNVLSNSTIDVELQSSDTSFLDAPKLSGAANSTTFDWWYFDAVSASSNASVTVVFYNGGPNGFLNTYQGGPLDVTISGTFTNGTPFGLDESVASSAVVQYTSGAIAADWTGSGFSFAGSSLSLGGLWTVSINAPSIGLTGVITLRSVAPAHYPCGLDGPGQTEQVLPNIGWANAVPDAQATASLTFFTDDETAEPTTLEFSDGAGYHDKNWGAQSFVSSTSQWYWGHARLGPYSLVWFDALDWAGDEYVSGYVVQDGKVLEASCTAQAVTVRPWGINSTYPPTLATGLPEGLEATFDLGNGTTLAANVTTGAVAVFSPGYLRALGTVEGGIVGGEMYTGGRTLFEQFALLGSESV